MKSLIYPEIFNGNVKAFFTNKTVGIEIEEIIKSFSSEKKSIFLPIQKHTDNIIILTNDIKPKIADAVITQRKDIFIGVQTADCVPILVFDKKKSVVGSIHAGWRGTATQIAKKAIEKMEKFFKSQPKDIFVAIGPSIRKCCYEVGLEVKEAVYKATGEGNYYIKNGEKHYYLDLALANLVQIRSLGILEKNIWISKDCTHCNPEKYFSYRYSKSYEGSQGGFIGLL